MRSHWIARFSRAMTASVRGAGAQFNASHFANKGNDGATQQRFSSSTHRFNGPLVPKLGAGYSSAMRIIARRTLRDFVASRAGHKDHPALKAALDAWFDEVRKAQWRSTSDIKRLYATASVVTSERVVFNIKGNSYRLVVAVDFDKGIVWIKWIGTHRDYDRIDVAKVKHEK
jgi:mRNA interferase HigB